MSYMCACGRSSSCLCELHTETGGEQPVTAVDVDALAKLREAATPGPWDYGITGIYTDRLAEVGQVGSTDDAALIVAAVNALPDLLAEVRRGRALREDLTAIVNEMEDDESIGIPPNVPLLIEALRAVLVAVDAS